MVINKKIKRTMAESKSQYIGSLLLIIISCFMYTLFNQLAVNMTKSVNAFEKDYVQEDAGFTVDKEITGLDALEAKFNLLIEETKTLDYSLEEDKVLRIFSENEKVDIPAVIEGTSLSEGGILIDPAFAKTNGIEIGDTVHVMDNAFKVEGFMSLPNYIYPIKEETDIINDPKAFGIAVITKEDFAKLGSGTHSYAIAFKGDRADMDKEMEEVKGYLTSSGITILKWLSVTDNPRVVYVTAKITGIKEVSTSLPVFILLLTCILTGIVMWRLLKKEFIAIGTLYAIGYRKREIARHYLAYPLSIALLGGILGTLFGFLTLKPMLDYMVTYFNIPLPSINIDLKYGAVSMLLPLIFLYVSGFFVINRALKWSPLELMKGGRQSHKVGFIEKGLKLKRLKFTRKFKIREQLRNIPRSIFLLLGVVIATMLLLMGFAMKSSLDYLMKDTYENTYLYENQYIFNSLQTEEIEGGEGFSMASFQLKEDKSKGISIYGINEDSKYMLLKDEKGNKLPTSQVIITKPLADRLKLAKGDTISIIDKQSQEEYEITIDAIAVTYVGEYIYMPLEAFNKTFGYPQNSYQGVWSDKTLALPSDALLSTTTLKEQKAGLDSIMGPMEAYMEVIAILAFVIGLIVIYVVTSLIIEENKENISLMKVLGYHKKEVYSLILNSSSGIVIVGYIIGIPLLLMSITAMFASVEESMNFILPITIDYVYIIAGFVIIYMTYEISIFLSRKKINRISMSEALKSRME